MVKIWPKACYCTESTFASNQLFNFMEAFIFKWKPRSEFLQSLLQCLPSEGMLVTGQRGLEPCSKGRAQCRMLSFAGHRDRFLSACFQKQLATWMYKGTIFLSCSLPHGLGCAAKAVPTPGQLLGKSLGSGQWLHTEIHLLTRHPHASVL